MVYWRPPSLIFAIFLCPLWVHATSCRNVHPDLQHPVATTSLSDALHGRFRPLFEAFQEGREVFFMHRNGYLIFAGVRGNFLRDEAASTVLFELERIKGFNLPDDILDMLEEWKASPSSPVVNDDLHGQEANNYLKSLVESRRIGTVISYSHPNEILLVPILETLSATPRKWSVELPQTLGYGGRNLDLNHVKNYLLASKQWSLPADEPANAFEIPYQAPGTRETRRIVFRISYVNGQDTLKIETIDFMDKDSEKRFWSEAGQSLRFDRMTVELPKHPVLLGYVKHQISVSPSLAARIQVKESLSREDVTAILQMIDRPSNRGYSEELVFGQTVVFNGTRYRMIMDASTGDNIRLINLRRELPY